MKIDFKLRNHNIVLAGATKGVGFELAKLLTICEANIVPIYGCFMKALEDYTHDR